MTIGEALQAGHRRVRKPVWANAEDYLLLPEIGPWARLYSPVQLVFDDIERPQKVLLIGDTDTDWVVYEGSPAVDEKTNW